MVAVYCIMYDFLRLMLTALLFFAGYQASGTRGADIINGKKAIKIFGETVPIEAEIQVLSNMSAHADYEEILQWLSHFNHPPSKIFINHGEPDAARALKEKIDNLNTVGRALFLIICNRKY